MNHKKYLIAALCLSIAVPSVMARATFNKTKDILLAQFDSTPDPDDIHAQAALGSMLVHQNFQDVECYAVQGAVGEQGYWKFIDSDSLFDLAFGSGNWTDAKNDWNGSVTRIKNRIKPILLNGGKVWVQEAGQSDITADWLRALANDGVSASVIKNNVIIVQHSDYNIDKTHDDDLAYVQQNATWVRLDDGNDAPQYGEPQWPDTPGYRDGDTSLMIDALDASNPNAQARALWAEAKRIIDDKVTDSWPPISQGGVDFSDCVENWWIFEVNGAWNASEFWNMFVVNDTGNNSGAPIGSTIALKAKVNGKYVCADKYLDATNWNLAANRTAVGAWEKFVVVDAGGGLIALKANANNKYVCADKYLDAANWKLAANRTAIGAWEKFTWIANSDGTVSLKANGNSKYVCADAALNGTVPPLVANRTAIGAWEKFTVETQ